MLLNKLFGNIFNKSKKIDNTLFQNIIVKKINIISSDSLNYYNFSIAKIDGNNDILIIIVGCNGTVNGYENKYFRIAENANKIYGSKVYIFANNEQIWNYPKNCFNSIIQYVKDDNKDNKDINIKLFGISAGAALAIYYAWEYSEIKNMLLINPPIVKENFKLIINGMSLYNGKSTLIIGKKDPSYEFGTLFEHEEYLNTFNNIIFFENADHRFNGLIEEFINLPFKYLFDELGDGELVRNDVYSYNK